MSNPYTGVLAIFAARYLNRRPALVFEDGRQRRDFVSVHDVATACRLALQVPRIGGHIFNIGSGISISILEVAHEMARAMGLEQLAPVVTQQYRVGDIRHCFADVSLAATMLGYAPRVELSAGLAELVEWIAGQSALDRVEAAAAELAARGLRW